VVLQDIDSIGGTLWKGPGRMDTLTDQTNFAQRVGVWLQLQCLDVVPFLCFGSLWGVLWMDEHAFLPV
jgi:hypothetical protein